MTPAALAALYPLDAPDAAALLRALEIKAEENPMDLGLARATEEAVLMASAALGLPEIVGGVRRERLLCWDRWSSTWEGPLLSSGARAWVRALRAEHLGNPAAARILARDARALRGLMPKLIFGETWPALVTEVSGEPLGPARGAAEAAHLWGAALAALEPWARMGVGIEADFVESLRVTKGSIGVFSLAPQPPAAWPALLKGIAALLGAEHSEEEGFPWIFLRSAASHPFPTVEAAREATQAALRDDLMRETLALRAGWVSLLADDRGLRLLYLLRRLIWAVPAPEGVGALGVDMDGTPLVLRSIGGAITWGPAGATPEVLCDVDGVVEPRAARRALRTRAMSPLKPHLQQAVGGDARFVEALVRWLSTRLGLRTLTLLLERR